MKTFDHWFNQGPYTMSGVVYGASEWPSFSVWLVPGFDPELLGQKIDVYPEPNCHRVSRGFIWYLNFAPLIWWQEAFERASASIKWSLECENLFRHPNEGRWLIPGAWAET
jgi:hypothetical protein